jgi:hypothetical protein
MAVTLGCSTKQLLNHCLSNSGSRLEFWVEFIRSANVQRMVEVGVYRGDFAASVLDRCESVTRYYMVDPWRHLEDWNKPANQGDAVFEGFFQEAKEKTDFAESRRVILRGKTTEVINQIPNGELDFAYIDGDHSLRGITIDLIRVYPKLRLGGFLAGDDFSRTIWQHTTKFEPTLVFPFAVYFAEAVGATVFAISNSQFCLQKTDKLQFDFVDLTGHYNELGLRQQLIPAQLLRLTVGEKLPLLMRVARNLRALLLR